MAIDDKNLEKVSGGEYVEMYMMNLTIKIYKYDTFLKEKKIQVWNTDRIDYIKSAVLQGDMYMTHVYREDGTELFDGELQHNGIKDGDTLTFVKTDHYL